MKSKERERERKREGGKEIGSKLNLSIKMSSIPDQPFTTFGDKKMDSHLITEARHFFFFLLLLPFTCIFSAHKRVMVKIAAKNFTVQNGSRLTVESLSRKNPFPKVLSHQPAGKGGEFG